MVASPMTVRITAPLRSIATVAVAIMVTIEVEHLEQVPDGRAVAGHIGIMLMRDRVRQVIAAARRERLEVPIALDEFQDRDMVVVGVHDAATTRERRDHDERNTRAVAEEIERLDVA